MIKQVRLYRIFVLIALFLSSTGLSAQQRAASATEIRQRVKSLLARMTLEEKVAQLRSTWSASPKVTDALLADPHKMDSLFGQGIGMVNPDFDNNLEQSVHFRNAIQHYLKTHTRLGIPAIFLDEAHHGLLAQKVDVFPMSIGLACSWDTSLTEQIYAYVAGQAAVRGTNMVLAPVVDVCRDPRWGRTGETFGEDPYLNGLMGSAVVRGFQGSSDGSIRPGHVAATLKHFTGHGQPEGGQNQGPADFPERVLRTFHMEPFRLAIARAQPAAIMPAYVEIDGVPCHANRWLLTDVLRNEWHYQGVLVSDWWAIDQLFQKHSVAEDRQHAALQAFQAGVTVDLPSGTNYALLPALISAGKVSPTQLDEAVARMLTLKFKLGLFDHTASASLEKAEASVNRPGGRALALKAAGESMVLLKNDGILPLSPGRYHRIAVIGPCAAVNYLGDYSGVPVRNVSLLEGIRARAPGTEVDYARGVDLSLNGDTVSMNNFQYIDPIILPDHEHNRRLIDSAVALARSADLVICAVGTNEQFNREAEAPGHYGDISNLDLPSDQDELLKALRATGKPLVVYLSHGRPLSINYAADHANAILDGWFAGDEAGNAAAAILFGDVNPSGKLTISIPRSAGQLPVYYNHKPSAQSLPYVTEPVTPLYPFGFGLSYTHFRYAAIRLSANSMKMTGNAVVSVDVTNDGPREGAEIVELYFHQKVSSVTRPVKELKGFSRVYLQPHETRRVSFTVDASSLRFWNRLMKYVAEPGVVEIMIGGCSTQVQTTNLVITK